MEFLALLQSHFSHCCNDDWEHSYGIRIETLDNPGWKVEIDLVGTQYAEKAFEDFQLERSDDDWIVCRRNSERFEGFGGTNNLIEILQSFCAWANIGENN